MQLLDWIWLIPLFPLAGAVTMLLVGRRLDPQPKLSPVALAPELARELGRDTHHHSGPHTGQAHTHSGSRWRGLISWLCPGTVFLSLLLSVGAVLELAQKPHKVHEVVLYSWLAGFSFTTYAGQAARYVADLGFLLDPLSAVMILVVTFVGFVIHVYSIGYMGHETGYYRFFGYLNLFVFFMLMLVLANNYALLFVGWEGVGLCSYLLIGFYFHRKSASDAGNKAFIVNRIGDAAFICGLLLMFAVLGSVRFLDVQQALEHQEMETGFGILSLIALLLFIGATGKSAQVPLYVWLPDAMEGPTPVSALIHAATMVTAGVYMVARSSVLYSLTPVTSGLVATIGAFTAILAASIALVQTDIKRVLAYSTVSQLGYMFMAAGVGAYWVAIFHLYTHAFFKALLFLGAGSVIHALQGEQDIRKMGGLKDRIPVTYWTMVIASLAIAGIPGLAGFFSKDEILWQAYSSPWGSTALWAVGTVTALMTAFYMWRLMFLTFHGPSRVEPHVAAHIHESPRVMTIPLLILAAGSALGGWIGVPKAWHAFGDQFRLFEHWLEPVFETANLRLAMLGAVEHSVQEEWALMGLSVLVAIAGIALARYLYVVRPELPDRIRESSGPIYQVLRNKWYVDELYYFLFVDGLAKGGGRLLGRFDQAVIDGWVNGTAWFTRLTSAISGWWDFWVVDGAVRLLAFVVKVLSYPVRVLQTGYVQAYALAVVLGAAAALGYIFLR